MAVAPDDEDAAQTQALELELAADLQRRWGCPAAGHRPPATLDADPNFDLPGLVALHHRLTGAPPTGTCPRAVLERAPPLLVDVTRAAATMDESQGAVSFAEALPDREWGPTRVDVQAYQLLVVARRRARASDDELAERERRQRRPPASPTE
jgi:hypothetical protein